MRLRPLLVSAVTATMVIISSTAASAASTSDPDWGVQGAQVPQPAAAASDANLDWMPTAAVVAPGSASLQAPSPQVASAAAPVWAVACSGTGRQDKVVRGGYTRKSVRAKNNNQYLAGGSTDMTCGFHNKATADKKETGMGYIHIAARHLNDWQNLAFYTGENWRDVADAGMVASLGSPDYAGSDIGGGKMCFSGNISLVNKRTGQVVKTQDVRTIVQYQKPNRVITTNPGRC